MACQRTTDRRGRVWSRLAAALATLALIGAVNATTAAPATAATCATQPAHVYVTSPEPIQIRFEGDPVDGAFAIFFLGGGDPRSSVLVKVGGNGLKPGTTPSWNVYRSDGSFYRTITSSTTGSNCVSNERETAIPRNQGLLLFRANYDAGNTGAQIREQNHFAIAL